MILLRLKYRIRPVGRESYSETRGRPHDSPRRKPFDGADGSVHASLFSSASSTQYHTLSTGRWGRSKVECTDKYILNIKIKTCDAPIPKSGGIRGVKVKKNRAGSPMVFAFDRKGCRYKYRFSKITTETAVGTSTGRS